MPINEKVTEFILISIVVFHMSDVRICTLVIGRILIQPNVLLDRLTPYDSG